MSIPHLPLPTKPYQELHSLSTNALTAHIHTLTANISLEVYERATLYIIDCLGFSFTFASIEIIKNSTNLHVARKQPQNWGP